MTAYIKKTFLILLLFQSMTWMLQHVQLRIFGLLEKATRSKELQFVLGVLL